MRDYKVIGKPQARLDAVAKVTGNFKYPTDLLMPNMLHVKVLRSPWAHAKILSIDTSAAEAMEGVEIVLTSKDVTAKKFGEGVPDMNIFAREKVRYAGEPVAAVAADSIEIAEKAIKAIKVEYEKLPVVLDAEEAMKEGAPLVHDNCEKNIAVFKHVERGNVEEAFKRADVTAKVTIKTPYQYQAPIEPNACVIQKDHNGKYTVWSPNQAPAWLRSRLSDLFEVSMHNIRVIQVQGGGAFGGKCPLTIEPICFAFAMRTTRPVRLANTREEEFCSTWVRVGAKIIVELAASKDGTLLAKRSQVICDNGAYSTIAPGVLSTMVSRVDNLYRIKNIDNVGYLVYTNKVPTGMFRGFGNPQATYAQELCIEKLALKLGMDSAELRLKNAAEAGDITVHGWEFASCELKQCIKNGIEKTKWIEKRKRNNKDGKKAYGIGLAACLHVAGNRGVYPSFDGSAAEVRISVDGNVTLLSGEGEIGCGTPTAFAQIAAEVLGIDIGQVNVPQPDSDYSPFGLGAYASRVTVIGGNAVKAAAEDARRQLLEAAAEMMAADVKDLTLEGGKVYGPDGKVLSFSEVATQASYKNGGTVIVGRGNYVPTNVTIADKNTVYGNISPSCCFECQIAEVEVDKETGEVTLLNIHTEHDIGKAINPMAVEGQIEGGICNGVGYALTEKLHWDKDGKIINPDYRDYRLPTMMDMPEISIGLIEPVDKYGPFGAKSVAEASVVPTAAAIAAAIYNAVGIIPDELPFIPEVLARLIEENEK